MDFLRFYEGTAVIYVNREGREWQVEWVLLGRIFFRPYSSFGAIVSAPDGFLTEVFQGFPQL